MIIQALDTHRWLLIFARRVIDGATKEPGEPLEGVLIHRINDGKVNDSEEENLGSVGDFPVFFSGLVNLFLGYGRLFQTRADVIGGDLGVIQDYNELVSFQDCSDVIIPGETFQDLLFNLKQISCSLCILLHNYILSLLLLRHLLDDKLVKHLFLKTFRRNGKVEQRDLNLSLGRVVGVWQCCSHEEPELFVPGDLFVANADSTRLVDLFLEYRLERGVKVLAHVFNEDPITLLDGLLQDLHQARIRCL